MSETVALAAIDALRKLTKSYVATLRFPKQIAFGCMALSYASGNKSSFDKHYRKVKGVEASMYSVFGIKGSGGTIDSGTKAIRDKYNKGHIRDKCNKGHRHEAIHLARAHLLLKIGGPEKEVALRIADTLASIVAGFTESQGTGAFAMVEVHPAPKEGSETIICIKYAPNVATEATGVGVLLVGAEMCSPLKKTFSAHTGGAFKIKRTSNAAVIIELVSDKAGGATVVLPEYKKPEPIKHGE